MAEDFSIGYDANYELDAIISQEGLYSGTYIIGVQGSGKTSILTNIGLHQIEEGNSVIALDPTTGGDMIRDIISRMPEERIKDTYIFSVSNDFKFPFGLPIFSLHEAHNLGYEEREAIKNQVFTAFEKLWPEARTQVYFRKMLRNIIPILLDSPNFTLVHIPRFFSDEKFRQQVLATIKDDTVVRFWRDFGAWTKQRKEDETNPFLSRVDDLLSDGFIKYHICQKPKGKDEIKDEYKRRLVNLRQLIFHNKIVLIHLPLDQAAYRNASRTIGIFFMMLLYSATFSFGKIPNNKRPSYTVLVDEFAKWAIGSADEFRDLLSYGRKYGIQLVLANQYLGQFDEEGMTSLKDAVTTAHTIISMRTNRADAEYLASLFEGYDEENDEDEEEEEEFDKESTNLYTEVLNNLAYHPNQTVKNFYMQWVKQFQSLASQRPAHGENFPSMPVTHWGNTNYKMYFNPQDIQRFLEALNSFLYDCEQTTCFNGDTAFDLKELFISSLMGEFYKDYDAKYTHTLGSSDSSPQIAKLRDFISDKYQLSTFYNDLYKTAHALMDYPLYIDRLEVEREKREWERQKERDEEDEDEGMTAEQVERKLSRLENRTAFVKLGWDIFLIKTIDLPDPVSWGKTAQRMNDILARTKYTFCRGKEEVKKELEESFTSNTVDGTQQQSDTLHKYEDLEDF